MVSKTAIEINPDASLLHHNKTKKFVYPQKLLSPGDNKNNKKFLLGGPDVSRGQFFQKAPPLVAGGEI